MSRLSVVIPAYNESAVIATSLRRILSYLDTLDGGELIVVDDGSSDGTPEIVREIAERNPQLRLLVNERNRGKGFSVRNGVLAAQGDHVLYTDADLVFPIEGVEPFVEALKAGADVAIASRSHERSLFALHPRHFSYIHRRYLVGRVFIRIVRALLDLPVTDTQAGFKCMRREAAREIFSRLTISSFAFDVEAIYIAHLRRLQIAELPVYFHYTGEQSSVQLAKDSFRMLRALFRIRTQGRRGDYSRAVSTESGVA